MGQIMAIEKVTGKPGQFSTNSAQIEAAILQVKDTASRLGTAAGPGYLNYQSELTTNGGLTETGQTRSLRVGIIRGNISEKTLPILEKQAVQYSPDSRTTRFSQKDALVPVAPVRSQVELWQETLAVAGQISDIMLAEGLAAKLRRDISKKEYSGEILELARLTQEVRNGAVPQVDVMALLEPTSDESKLKLVAKRLRLGLATLILSTENSHTRGRFGRMGNPWTALVQETIDFGGRGAVDTINNALSLLSSTERTLATSLLSDSVSASLGYPDIDECKAGRFANYIRRVSTPKEIKGQGERDDQMEFLIETALERENNGTINPEDIITELLHLDKFEDIVESLKECARLLRFEETLLTFFSFHPNTLHIARKIRESIDDNYQPRPLPPRRRLD